MNEQHFSGSQREKCTPRCKRCVVAKRSLKFPDSSQPDEPSERPPGWNGHLQLLAMAHRQESPFEEFATAFERCPVTSDQRAACAMASLVAIDRTNTSFKGRWELRGDEVELVHEYLHKWSLTDPIHVILNYHPHPGQRLKLLEIKLLLDTGWDPDFDLLGSSMTPLASVMFALSDAMIESDGFDDLAKLTTLLLEYGADPASAVELAEERYGKYRDGLGGYPIDDDNVWVAYRILTEASELYADPAVNEKSEIWATRLNLSPECRSVKALAYASADPAETKFLVTSGVAASLAVDQQQYNQKLCVDRTWQLYTSYKSDAAALAAMVQNGFFEMPMSHPALQLLQRVWQGRAETLFT